MLCEGVARKKDLRLVFRNRTHIRVRTRNIIYSVGGLYTLRTPLRVVETGPHTKKKWSISRLFFHHPRFVRFFSCYFQSNRLVLREEQKRSRALNFRFLFMNDVGYILFFFFFRSFALMFQTSCYGFSLFIQYYMIVYKRESWM